MPKLASADDGQLRRRQRWPWWPLLPLYPYGRRRTLVRELVPDQVWAFEQVQGVWYVAVPIRMTVLRVRAGLVLYAPVAPTTEVLEALAALERRYGPVCTIVLPSASGLEHKLPVPAMARAYPTSTVWVTAHQWSFPLPLPLPWLGFPAGRTRVLLQDGVPHGDELDWCPLGPLDLGLGTFLEIACLHRSTGSLLVTDALVAISAEPPPVMALDPTPMLFHARERGDEPMEDSPERRRRGWLRLVLFANYLRPEPLTIPPLKEVLGQALAPGCRSPQSHFGLYPFRWQPGWQAQAEALTGSALGADPVPQVAAVLERLVFVRARGALVQWLQELARLKGVKQLIPAHYSAPVPISAEQLRMMALELEHRKWAPSQGSWSLLAAIDGSLLALGLVPGDDRAAKH